MSDEEPDIDDVLKDYIPELQDMYNSRFPGDRVEIVMADPEDYEIQLHNSRDRDLGRIEFHLSIHDTGYRPEDFMDEGALNLTKLAEMYREESVDPETRAVEFSATAKDMAEEEENLWYSINRLGKEVIEPDLALRPNLYDHLYLFRV